MIDVRNVADEFSKYIEFDSDKKGIHLFFIPANSLSSNDIYPRSDTPSLIDLKINYNDCDFEDNRSKFCFKKWFKKTLKY